MDGIEPRKDISYGTDRYWRKVRSKQAVEEIVETRNHGYGIGIVRKTSPENFSYPI